MENAPCPSPASAPSLSAEAALEAKRERLMRKVELAKQGWTGVAVTAGPEPSQSQSESKAEGGDDLDTTPYEEIDEEEEEDDAAADQTVLRRPPVGELPSFIPLSRDSGDEDGGDEVAVEDSLSSVAKDDSVVAANEEEFEERLI